MKIRVNKLGVARRQINTAIDLWFSGGDAISIHTLVAAAYQILCDLLNNKNLPDFLYNNPNIRPERRADYAKLVRKPANFFKHADRDPDEVLEVNVEINDFLLLQCLTGVQQLGVTEITDTERAFWVRFGFEYPEVLDEGHPFTQMIHTDNFREIAAWPRPRFYEAFKMEAATLSAAGKMTLSP
jgi:hypothetical protein